MFVPLRTTLEPSPPESTTSRDSPGLKKSSLVGDSRTSEQMATITISLLSNLALTTAATSSEESILVFFLNL